MSISITDLFSTSTRDQIFNSIAGILAGLALQTTSWVVGGQLRTFMVGVSQKISDFTVQISEINKGGFRETATGNWLKFLSRNMYNVDYIPAAAGALASSGFSFTNASAVTYGPFLAGTVHMAHNVTGKTYTNTQTVTITASVSTPCSIIADEVGTASNANPGQISVMVTALSGVTCSNSVALVGVAEESDSALAQRDLDKLGALSPNGPSAAYAYFAKGVVRADGSIIDVNRTKVATGANGVATLTVASSTGTVAGPIGTPGTDLYLINQSIQLNVVPVGVTATVQSATTTTQAVTGTMLVSSKSNKTSSEVQALVATALADYFPTVPIGGVNGFLYVDALKAVIFQSVRDASGISYVRDVDISVPAADVALGAIVVPVLGTVTMTVTFITES